jgi:hypothetical protein
MIMIYEDSSFFPPREKAKVHRIMKTIIWSRWTVGPDLMNLQKTPDGFAHRYFCSQLLDINMPKLLKEVTIARYFSHAGARR